MSDDTPTNAHPNDLVAQGHTRECALAQVLKDNSCTCDRAKYVDPDGTKWRHAVQCSYQALEDEKRVHMEINLHRVGLGGYAPVEPIDIKAARRGARADKRLATMVR